MFENIEPKLVFEYFKLLNQIPRGSGNESAASAFLVRTAHDLGLKCIQEECGNVIITKPASKEYENHGSVVLQAHMDMVCVKADNSCHDFFVDPIKMIIDGDILRADGTTLGSDNGIGCAIILAVLADNTLSHPEVIGVFTVDEEVGMTGVMQMDMSHIKDAKYMINLDSESKGNLCLGCAGGRDINLTHPILWQANPIENAFSYEVSIKGLQGGHSGIDINKNRANAIKLMGRLLFLIDIEEMYIFDIEGGTKRNAIPLSSSVKFICKNDKEFIHNELNRIEAIFKDEYSVSDPDLYIEFGYADVPEYVYSEQTQYALVCAMNVLPTGVSEMDQNILNLPVSSSNMAIVEADKEKITIHNSLRSNVESKKDELTLRFSMLAPILNFSVEIGGGYPAWAYKKDSKLREIMIEAARKSLGVEPELQVIHAGLECALFYHNLPHLDIVSIGADIFNPHTINEYVTISSVRDTYKFLLETLKNL